MKHPGDRMQHTSWHYAQLADSQFQRITAKAEETSRHGDGPLPIGPNGECRLASVGVRYAEGHPVEILNPSFERFPVTRDGRLSPETRKRYGLAFTLHTQDLIFSAMTATHSGDLEGHKRMAEFVWTPSLEDRATFHKLLMARMVPESGSTQRATTKVSTLYQGACFPAQKPPAPGEPGRES